MVHLVPNARKVVQKDYLYFKLQGLKWRSQKEEFVCVCVIIIVICLLSMCILLTNTNY